MLFLQTINVTDKNTTTTYSTDSAGLKQGVSVTYNTSALLKMCQYVDDKLNGVAITYYHNSKIKSKESYQNNKKHGTQYYFSSDTIRQVKEINYVNGDIVSKRYLADINGKPICLFTCQYRSKKMHGPAIYYNQNGSKQKEEIWDQGTKVENIEYRYGYKVKHTKFSGNTVVTEEYYPRNNNSRLYSRIIIADDAVAGTKTETIEHCHKLRDTASEQFFNLSNGNGCPKELWQALVQNLVSTVVTKDKNKSYNLCEPGLTSVHVAYIGLGEYVYSVTADSKVFNTVSGKKDGEYTEKEIKYAVVYNSKTKQCGSLQTTILSEKHKFYLNNKAFGFYKNITGNQVKEYFRSGSKNIPFDDIAGLLGHTDNHLLTASDQTFVNLRYL